MTTPMPDVQSVEGTNCLTQRAERLQLAQGRIKAVYPLETAPATPLFIGPGLVDLQLNGINGIDFNDVRLRPEDVLEATQHVLRQGVTTFFPTLITNADASIHQLLRTLVQACRQYPLVDACIGGIHLEGPFLSKADGARGAHPLAYIRAPEWAWVSRCQSIAEGRIRLLTFSPEWAHAEAFVRECRKHHIQVAIGHSMASPAQIRQAVAAGARLSTHLGNAVPLMLPRHPNVLWEQLAEDGLYASLIADGFHLPDAFLKVALKTKGSKAFLVSDATCFSGMAPGVYQTHIGEKVILTAEGRLCMSESPELLAGATKSLLEGVQYLFSRQLLSLADAWKMASVYPAAFLGKHEAGLVQGQPADLLTFTLDDHRRIQIKQLIKQGRVVFEEP